MASDIPDATRKLVLERDGHRCRFCGATNQGVQIHHIIYRSQGGGHHHPSILITLCPKHHRLVHSDKPKYESMLFELLKRGPGITGLQLMRVSPANVPIPLLGRQKAQGASLPDITEAT